MRFAARARRTGGCRIACNRPILRHHVFDGLDEWRFQVLRLLPAVGIEFLNEIRRAHFQRGNHRLQILAPHQHHHEREAQHEIRPEGAVIGDVEEPSVARRARRRHLAPDLQSLDAVFRLEGDIFVRLPDRRHRLRADRLLAKLR